LKPKQKHIHYTDWIMLAREGSYEYTVDTQISSGEQPTRGGTLGGSSEYILNKHLGTANKMCPSRLRL
jgi:hypothetical protein